MGIKSPQGAGSSGHTLSSLSSTCTPHSSSKTPILPNLTLPIFVSALPGAFEGCFIPPSLLNESLYSFLVRLSSGLRGHLPANAGGIGDGVQGRSGSGRSPGGTNGNTLWYSCLGNPIDRRVWLATVHGVAKSRTWLRDWACRHPFLVRKQSLGWPAEVIWGGWWERGSGLGTHVHLWWIHVNVWQNQYSIIK